MPFAPLKDILAAAQQPYDPNETFGLNPNSSRFAENARALLLRNQYDRWSQNFEPIENELLANYSNPGFRSAAAGRAVDLFNRGADAGDAITQRRLTGLGLELTPEQKTVADRASGMQRGLGEVNAYNQTVRLVDDRNKALLTGLGSMSRGGM